MWPVTAAGSNAAATALPTILLCTLTMSRDNHKGASADTRMLYCFTSESCRRPLLCSRFKLLTHRSFPIYSSLSFFSYSGFPILIVVYALSLYLLSHCFTESWSPFSFPGGTANTAVLIAEYLEHV
ncbi:hypothetical protein F5883DRAFT_561820 [Diaporthe sp. PMI_573]|nr:hypothetical protein F5883DRAFT_561820 [Diaporthaceae sp. PMI_573]